MKKIGLLTYHHTTNFGSMLQTYALYEAVEKLGYRCEVINYLNEAVEKREFVKRIRDCKSLREVKNVIKYGHIKRRKSREMSNFFRANMRISENTYVKENISGAELDYDALLVGSDMVWDFTINDADATYMLDFAEDSVKKIAYASSVGTMWFDTDINHVTRLLNRFDRIGVREMAVHSILSEKLEMNPDFVCDPTMLISGDVWKSMAGKRNIDGEYVIVYMVDEKQKIYEDAMEYGKKHGIPVHVIHYGGIDKKYSPIRPTSIEEFLSLILYANTVFSASYHGLLFSLYFNKNVFFYNRGWKERMKSIANFLNIENRNQWDSSIEYEPIRYDCVNEKITEFRNSSLNLLRDYLSICNEKDS